MTQSLSESITENLSYILESIGNSDDIVSRTFRAGPDGQIQVCILYTDGLTDTSSVQEFTIAPLMNHIGPREVDMLLFG